MKNIIETIPLSCTRHCEKRSNLRIPIVSRDCFVVPPRNQQSATKGADDDGGIYFTSLSRIIPKIIYATILSLCLLTACRDDEEIFKPEVIPVAPPDNTAEILGFYLLNEGNMGTNKSTLDYFDFATGEYHRNIYADANPGVPKELGDVGNDIQIYGSKLYAVINCSNKIEVMDKFTTRRLGQIDIPNCRYICFHEGYAYITSYAGPVEINPNYEQRGYVAKVDTASLQIVAKCLVGFQPDELEIVNGKIYVANSGGYMFPNYESTVSVIDISSFTETKRIEVDVNLHRLEADRHGVVWVSSRGDYFGASSRLYWIDTKTDTYGGMLDVAVSEMTINGDSLYLYSTEFSQVTFEEIVTYGIVDVKTKQIVTRNFLAGGAEMEIAKPYGIMVNPQNKDIYLTDAANHVYPGMLFCFDQHGNKKWEVRTGDIPAHLAILYE
ncbi:MAG: YncE family protein [Prevotellaceae bacterium]|jgi:DNA-binding beta-propeller fold protein YncE|nr:YncE family protein [Prevotellaceae bacterium]